MKRTPAVPIPEVPGIDLSFRPRDYFWASALRISLPNNILGQNRRLIVRNLLESGRPLPPGIDDAMLDEATRSAWGRLDPSNMGGEYLSPLRKGEVEIVRVSLKSVTADQISIRARPIGQRIAYRVVDEYETYYSCHPASSRLPLTLEEIVVLIETASDGGGIVFPVLAMNMGHGSSPTNLATFVTVESDFYADIGAYYRERIAAWLEEQMADNRDEE